MTDNKIERTQKDKQKHKRYYTIGIWVFLVMDLLLLTFIVISMYYLCSDRKRDISPETDICVPCRVLKIHPDDIFEGLKYKGKTKELCCIEDKKIDVFIGNFVDHWLKERLANDKRQFIRYKCKDDSASGGSKPTIKLVGKEERQSGEHHKVLWDGLSDAVILPDSRDITHHTEHGFIEIKKPGLYQIYTQVVLNRDDKDWYNKPHKSSIYQHYVIYIEAGRSNAQEKIILKSSNTYCSHKADNQAITSYLGGAFQLVEGDKLAVKIHHKTEIVPIAHMNFFGAYML